MPVTHIPAAHRKLFQQCRYLIECVDGLNRVLSMDETTIAALAALDLEDLPLKTPVRIRRKLRNLKRCIDIRSEKQAELDAIAVRAERATHRIADDDLRQVVKLYFLDGLSIDDVVRESGLPRKAVQRQIKIVYEPAKPPQSARRKAIAQSDSACAGGRHSST